jgi:hypothetical protein
MGWPVRFDTTSGPPAHVSPSTCVTALTLPRLWLIGCVSFVVPPSAGPGKEA